MSRRWRRPTLIVASVLLGYLAVRPRMLRWGATREEAAEALAGVAGPGSVFKGAAAKRRE